MKPNSVLTGYRNRVVVGTPGRLLDHIKRRNIRLDGIADLILDETNENLDTGYKDDIKSIIDLYPIDGQKMLFGNYFVRGVHV